MRTQPLPALAALLFAAAISSSTVLAPQNDAQPAAAPAPVQPTTAPADPTISPLRTVGNGVLPPTLTKSAEPKFTDEAREQRVNGMVLIGLIVDTNGVPRNVQVIRGVGMGLDEKALEAVKKYRFKPAIENGKPVPVRLNVEVNFQIFEDAPTVLHSVPLDISDEARQKHAKGSILVGFTVDENGDPHDVRVVSGVGMGMDELAVEAVKRYKFAPIVEGGQPLAKPFMLQLRFNAK